jgi:hypothetical protein
MPVTLALRRLRQEDREFKASQGYTVRLCHKKIIKWGGGSLYFMNYG